MNLLIVLEDDCFASFERMHLNVHHKLNTFWLGLAGHSFTTRDWCFLLVIYGQLL